MTIGISRERLREIKEACVSESSIAFLNLLLSECTELNPWSPIDESTPEDRRILLFNKDIFIGHLNVYGKYELDSGYIIKPTHWQELPQDPK